MTRQPVPDLATHADDQQLTCYLLGLLGDEETEHLDEAAMVDDDVASRLRVVENDLVDAYVRGTLAESMRERFESRFLASARGRERVRFAQRFVSAIDRAAPPVSDEREASERSPDLTPAPLRFGHRLESRGPAHWKWSWTLLAAAALLCIVCGTLLFQPIQHQSVSPAGGTEHVEAPPLVSRPIEPFVAPQRDGAARMAREPIAATPVMRSDESGRHHRSGGPAPATALLLLPQTRGVTSVATVTIPATGGRVRFELQLDANEYQEYRVRLTDPASNATVWRSGPLTAASSGDTASVTVVVPSGLLRSQHYSFALVGRSTAADPAIVSTYTFQAVRP